MYSSNRMGYSKPSTPKCPSVQYFISSTEDEKKKFEENCNVYWPCRECSMDLVSSVCPFGWGYSAGLCYPPSNSGSHCSEPRSFQFMEPELRYIWAIDCGVSWPCFDSNISGNYESKCLPDVHSPCPIGYIYTDPPINENTNINEEQNNGPYETSSDKSLKNLIEYIYTGNTINRDTLYTGSIDDYIGDTANSTFHCKSENIYISNDEHNTECPYGEIMDLPKSYIYILNMLQTCKEVKWKCMEACATDWDTICPHGYFLIRDTCVLQSTYISPLVRKRYEGICSDRISIKQLGSRRERQLFSFFCQIPWPCKADKYSLCEMDFSYPCPRDWKYEKERNRCKYRGGYNSGACGKEISVFFHPMDDDKNARVTESDPYRRINKMKIMSECQLVWPCKQY